MPREDRYTPDTGAAMRQAYEGRLSYHQVASRFGVSPTTGRSWLVRAGTHMRTPSKKINTVPPERKPVMMSLKIESRTRRHRLTTCPVCRLGIFEGDPADRKPGHLGPVHLHCTP